MLLIDETRDVDDEQHEIPHPAHRPYPKTWDDAVAPLVNATPEPAASTANR